jgi:hypothetical protein
LPERAKLIAEEWKALDAEEKEVSLLVSQEKEAPTMSKMLTVHTIEIQKAFRRRREALCI